MVPVRERRTRGAGAECPALDAIATDGACAATGDGRADADYPPPARWLRMVPVRERRARGAGAECPAVALLLPMVPLGSGGGRPGGRPAAGTKKRPRR